MRNKSGGKAELATENTEGTEMKENINEEHGTMK
jgi:hypothetical protein